MLATKVAAFFLVIASVRPAKIPSPRDLFDDADNYLQDYVVTVQAAIDESSAEFDRTEQVVQYVASESIRNAEGDLNSMSGLFARELDRVRERTVEENLDSAEVEACISLYESEMTNVPGYVRDLIHECVYNMQGNTTIDLQNARAQALSHLDTADELKADIDACHVVEDDQECISRVIIEILLQTLEAPISIHELARRANDLLNFYIYAIPDCTTDRINGVATIVSTVLTYINACVDNISAVSNLR